MARCQARTSNGSRCKAYALKGKKYCLFHSRPERKMRGPGVESFRISGKKKRRY